MIAHAKQFSITISLRKTAENDEDVEGSDFLSSDLDFKKTCLRRHGADKWQPYLEPVVSI
jgi:hypothetical protein